MASISRMTLALGLLLAGAGAASAQTSGIGGMSGGLQTNAPALNAPTAGDPALVNPSALEPVPNIVIPPPRQPVTPQPSCVTQQCGLPVIVAPLRR